MRSMSSDGATDKPRSSRSARGEDRGVAGIALAVLLILAIIATIVMIFSDNAVWMRIGTLAALWAAFIGAFLVARYRRQAAAEAARVRDLHTVYELQLEREISARREHELVVEKDLRDNIRAETSDSIYALRHEIAALREQLGHLGVTLPEDRYAVSGAGPAGELGTGQPLPSVPSERVEPRRRASGPDRGAAAGESADTASTAGAAAAGAGAAAAGAGLVGTDGAESAEPAEPAESTASAESAEPAGSTESAEPTATGVRRDSTPSTERTEKLAPVPPETDAGPEADRAAETGGERRRGPAVRPVTRPQPAVDPQQAAPAEPAAPADATPAEPAPDESTAAPGGRSRRAAEEDTAPSRHGESGGLTVAELMARLGSSDSSGGRRRRRAEG